MRDAESRFAESSRSAAVCGAGLAVCLFLILLGLFGARQAHAEITHKFDSNLPPVLNNPTSIAVDQSNGDIVVLESGGKLFKFNAAGAPVNFSALGKNELVPGCGSECRNLVIDNSGGVNQGVIYLASNETSPAGGSRQVRVFLQNGEKADSIKNWSTGERSHPFCGVATDQKGQVYIAHNQGYETGSQIPGGKADGTSYVDKLKPGTWVPEANEQKLFWPIQATMLGLSPEPNGGQCRVAANSQEDIYYSFYSEFEGGITPPIKRSPHTAYGSLPGPPVTVVDSGSAFAIDHTTDSLFSDRKTEIARFDSNNNLRERFGSAVGQLEEESFGVGINETDGTVYATNRLTDKISVFKAYVTPDVTYNPSSALQTTAGVSGKVGLAAAGNVTDCVIEYGPTTAYSAPPVKCTPDASGTPFSSEKEVTASLTGLSKETLYHYRISATNANGTTKGIDQTFTTHNVAGVTTGDATAVTQSSATLNGSFNGNGDATSIKFQWGPSTSYANETAPQPLGTPSGPTNVSAPITGLAVYTPNTGTYHYRLVATNGSGTTYGPDRVFHSAPPSLPTISNTESSAVTETEATLSTEVNPGNGDTSVIFEYGTGTGYGAVTLSSESIGNDETNHPVTAALGDLAPGTTYHFRVVASNFGGTTQSPDQTFTTAAKPAETPVEKPVETPKGTSPLTSPPATGDCDALSRRARKESKEAARLRSSAKKASSPKRASSLRRKAAKRGRKARQLNKRASACRSGGNG